MAEQGGHVRTAYGEMPSTPSMRTVKDCLPLRSCLTSPKPMRMLGMKYWCGALEAEISASHCCKCCLTCTVVLE
eukprot:6977618-Karenia_brevis.AAC.1